MAAHTDRHVGVIGATSAIGDALLPALLSDSWRVTAFTRGPLPQARGPKPSEQELAWAHLDAAAKEFPERDIANWICLARAYVLPEHFPRLEAAGVRRLVALSSTSRFTKVDAADGADRQMADRLARAEDTIAEWAQRHGVTWTILRPTLTYGGGRDRNITAMAGVIRKLGFFPLLGRASGLRQPVHVQDLADAARLCLLAPAAANQAYDVSGGETLSYREMAERVFAAMGRKPRLVSIPPTAIKGGIAAARLLPRFRDWSPGMAERMQIDMVFDHSAATRDFGYAPRPFRPTAADVGR